MNPLMDGLHLVRDVAVAGPVHGHAVAPALTRLRAIKPAWGPEGCCGKTSGWGDP